MGFKFEIPKKELRKIEEQIEDSLQVLKESLTYALGADLVGLIRNRVSRGIGLNDNAMKSKSKDSMGAYSKSYAKFRKKKGRTTDVRELSFYGRMMGGLTVTGPFNEGEVTYVNVTFAGGPDVMVKAINNNKMTPFFGISPSDRSILNAAIERYVQDFLANEKGGKNGRRKTSRLK